MELLTWRKKEKKFGLGPWFTLTRGACEYTACEPQLVSFCAGEN